MFAFNLLQLFELMGSNFFSVIDDALCEQRLWDMKDRGDQNFYMCEIRKDFTIDATFKGNASRFLNHSCDPNCKLEKWLVWSNLLLWYSLAFGDCRNVFFDWDSFSGWDIVMLQLEHRWLKIFLLSQEIFAEFVIFVSHHVTNRITLPIRLCI